MGKQQIMKQIAINDIGTAEDFLAAIDASIKTWSNKQPIVGTIVQIGRDGALVDIGDKTEAFLPKNQYSEIELGQEIEGIVLSKNEEGQYIISMKDIETEEFWRHLEYKYELSTPVTGKVVKIVKGGLIVDIGVKAFLPGSLIDVERVTDFQAYLGHEAEFLIHSIDREKSNVVLNRRSLIEKMIKEDKQIEFSKLAIGQIYNGKVSGITEYGIFVEIGILAGLVHKTKMGEITPDQFIVGQDVEVEIIDIDFEKNRFSLQYKG